MNSILSQWQLLLLLGKASVRTKHMYWTACHFYLIDPDLDAV